MYLDLGEQKYIKEIWLKGCAGVGFCTKLQIKIDDLWEIDVDANKNDYDTEIVELKQKGQFVEIQIT